MSDAEESKARWYVVHTYSGYENKVKADIEKSVENRGLEDQILKVEVPLQDVVEVKNGAKKQVSKKMFPGYVLLNMIMNDTTWYVVRNTRGVTGFVGPGSKPVPLTENEIRSMGVATKAQVEVDVEVGDTIKVISGAWEDTIGEVKSINMAKQSVTIDVDIFGRATSVEIGFLEVQKLS
ncbi:MAG: transcription termination/antitermination protein NusG [Lachnospiraceae bacterium]|nr:transcription termination/antitermination protein NusG [Lachnospiraceae bacterium]